MINPSDINALIVFAKHPEAGKVKTRLADDIGAQKALMVYEELLAHTVDTAFKSGFDTWIYYNHDDLPLPKPANRRQHFAVQNGSNLGERMHAAFVEIFEKGYQKAVIIGSDCLEITPNHIKNAFMRLSGKDLVVGPASDGGYYLLGLKHPHRFLFEGVDWSTKKVLQQTMDKANSRALSVFQLETLSDIDRITDLRQHPLLLNIVSR